MRRRHTKKEPTAQHTDEPPVWLRLAQEEIGMRTHAGADGPSDFLDRLLQLEERLTSQYPDMPFTVKDQFKARLTARGYTENAWNAAIIWLESTDWFRLRDRYLPEP